MIIKTARDPKIKPALPLKTSKKKSADSEKTPEAKKINDKPKKVA